jgi:two-component system chemotaxis response regulator CheY
MKVLVVDDSKAMRMILMRELKAAGISELADAASGEEALQRLEEESFDAVLCDWNMPTMTGLEVLEALHARGQKVPFGFVTADASAESRQIAKEAGAAFLVTKPFKGSELVSRIQEALSGAASRAPDEEEPIGESTRANHLAEAAALLDALLPRGVSLAPADLPRRSVPRMWAIYETPEKERLCVLVAELSAAAGLGGALTLVSPQVAAQWASAGALPETVSQNFGEVANVLRPLVSRWASRRCCLGEVGSVGEYEDLPLEAAGSRLGQAWLLAWVEVAGYPSGRLAICDVR